LRRGQTLLLPKSRQFVAIVDRETIPRPLHPSKRMTHYCCPERHFAQFGRQSCYCRAGQCECATSWALESHKVSDACLAGCSRIAAHDATRHVCYSAASILFFTLPRWASLRSSTGFKN
jgi:hypothetical protein